MIIKKSDAQFADIPYTLEGEVLLTRTYDGNGIMSGVITATLARCMEMKKKTDSELESEGWLQYKSVLDALP